jgi:hypothetical protein
MPLFVHLQHTSATSGFSFATMVTRLDNFCRFGYFWKFIDFFVKVKQPKNGDNLGNFLLNFFLIFTGIISSYKTWFVVPNLRFQKWFGVDTLDFQIVHKCRYFGISLALATFLATFLKLGQFFTISWSPCYPIFSSFAQSKPYFNKPRRLAKTLAIRRAHLLSQNHLAGVFAGHEGVSNRKRQRPFRTISNGLPAFKALG